MRKTFTAALIAVGFVFAAAFTAGAHADEPTCAVRVTQAQARLDSAVADARARAIELGISATDIDFYVGLLDGGVTADEQDQALKRFQASRLSGDPVLYLTLPRLADRVLSAANEVDDARRCVPASDSSPAAPSAASTSGVPIPSKIDTGRA